MRRYTLVLLSSSFVLHWVWEMSQMSAYRETAGRPWRDTLLPCTLAAFGDVLATVFVYGVLAILHRSLRWGLQASWRDYSWAALFGAAIAVFIEKLGGAYGQWSYRDVMPIVPAVAVGLLPLLQLITLIPLTLWISARFAHLTRSLSG